MRTPGSTSCSTSVSGGRTRRGCRCRSVSSPHAATSIALDDVSQVLREAIDAGLANRDEAMAYAMGFGRGIDAATADEFVAMYVNDLTLDMGERGRRARDGAARPRAGVRRRMTQRGRSSRPSARRSAATAAGSRRTRPDDLAALADPRGRRPRGRAGGADRGRLARLREPGGRGQPQRRAHGGAARRPARVGRRRHRQPALRVGSRGDRRRMPRGDRRRRRPLRRRRRRVDVARAARHRQARHGVSARRPHALRHDARLALPEPAARGAVPARDDGRDRRERRRALGGVARGSGRVRAALAAALGRRPPRRAGSTTSSCPSATSTRDEHPRPDTSAEKLASLRPAFRAGRHRHGGQLVRAQRRRGRARDRLGGEGARARDRAARRASSARRSPASIRA